MREKRFGFGSAEAHVTEGDLSQLEGAAATREPASVDADKKSTRMDDTRKRAGEKRKKSDPDSQSEKVFHMTPSA